MPAFLAATPGVKLLGVDISSQITSGLKGIPLIGGLAAKNKDPERMRNADALYARAVQGDRAAYDELGWRSGLIPDPNPTDKEGSWATAKAREYGASLRRQIDATGIMLQTLPAPKPLVPGGFGFGLPTFPLGGGVIQDEVEKVATAIGTTSSMVTWVALGLGLVLVIRSLRS